jgi:predicted secreted protein
MVAGLTARKEEFAMTRTAIGLAAAVIWAVGPLANAADAPAPQGVVNLAAAATAEVPKDMMSITFTNTREGPDANAIQAALKQALDLALAEAKKVSKPGQVDVQSGNFSLYPRYNNKGLISCWQGTAELIVQGRDMPAIGQLVGRISSMTVARVSYDLSREVREKAESDVAAQAIARYRAKAADYARQFGYAGYTLREVNVTANEPPGGPVPMMRAQMAAAKEDSPLPTEAGKAMVNVTVTGTVQMNR